MKKNNAIATAVGGSEPASQGQHVAGIDSVDSARPRAAGQQGKDARATADVDDDIVRTNGAVNGVSVGCEPRAVSDHVAEFVEEVHLSAAGESWHGKATREQAFSIAEEQITEGPELGWIAVRKDAANGNVRNEAREHFKFFGTLATIEQPVHIGVLDKEEKDLTRADFFDAGSMLSLTR